MKNAGILKKSLMVESLREILTKRRSQTFYKPVDVQSVTNAICESISSIRIWNIVNQLGKHDFLCGFSDQMNRNRFGLSLPRRY